MEKGISGLVLMEVVFQNLMVRSWTTYTTAVWVSGNSSVKIVTIAIDREGIKWFGAYYRGVTKV